ncbi:hypothetical protein Taro_004735 [Colocasia esculenta]|uniref:Uncharacterized protein n=1 Tax=Colocasia esculenta TaxID=4460 RepID=A0A843TVU0_COLES|nr:hypothetical protein [Colocasia esculenta]
MHKMASHGNYHDDRVGHQWVSSSTAYQSTSHSPSPLPLASQGSTSQLPPPRKPCIESPPLSMTTSTSSSTDAGLKFEISRL